jgi:hypothetical protein
MVMQMKKKSMKIFILLMAILSGVSSGIYAMEKEKLDKLKPLIIAIASKNDDLAKKIFPELSGKEKTAALNVAIVAPNPDLVAYFIQHGAQPNTYSHELAAMLTNENIRKTIKDILSKVILPKANPIKKEKDFRLVALKKAIDLASASAPDDFKSKIKPVKIFDTFENYETVAKTNALNLAISKPSHSSIVLIKHFIAGGAKPNFRSYFLIQYLIKDKPTQKKIREILPKPSVTLQHELAINNIEY